MRWRLCCLAGVWMVGAACATNRLEIAAPGGVEIRRGAGGVWWQRVTAQTFVSMNVSGDPLLVQQTAIRYERSDLDDDDVTLTSTAWSIDTRPPARRWTIVDHAESGSVRDGRFYVTHLTGLGTAESLDRVYDLVTGRFLFATTDVVVDVPPDSFPRERAGARVGVRAGLQWLTYLGAAGPETLPCAEPGDLGWLSLVGEDGNAQTLVVTTRDRTLVPWTPEWGVVDPRSGALTKRFPNASGWTLPLPAEVRLTFDGEPAREIRLRLTAEGLDAAHAVLSDGLALSQRACASTAPVATAESAERHRTSRGPWAEPR